MKITPAILPKTHEDLKQKISAVLGAVDMVQIDMCDGTFSDTITWPFYAKIKKKGSEADEEDDGLFGIDQHAQAILDEQEGLPYWEKMNFEFDLMVSDGIKHFDSYLKMGPTSIVFHLKKDDDKAQFSEFLEAIDIYTREQTKIGIAIETTDTIADFSSIISHVDFVQCMGIETIGYQAQPFDERVLEQIQTLRQMFPDIDISVDGGVNFDTAEELIAAGVTRLVIGSAIYNTMDPGEAIKEFESLSY